MCSFPTEACFWRFIDSLTYGKVNRPKLGTLTLAAARMDSDTVAPVTLHARSSVDDHNDEPAMQTMLCQMKYSGLDGGRVHVSLLVEASLFERCEQEWPQK